MRKSLIFIVLIAVFVMFSCPSGYAFWGKKKQDKTEEPQPKKVEAPVQVKQQEEMAPAPVKQAPKEAVMPQEEPAAVPAQPQISKEEELARAQAKALKDKTKTQMDKTSWTVKIMDMAGQGKAKQDKLIFKDKKFYSESYEAKGFSATNYTLTVKENGAAIWETMQSAQDGQIIFWRGEINSEMSQMRGVLSVQKAPGDSESFSFISEEKSPLKE